MEDVPSPDDVTWWSTLCAVCAEREGPDYQRCTCGDCSDCGEALEHCACEHVLEVGETPERESE